MKTYKAKTNVSEINYTFDTVYKVLKVFQNFSLSISESTEFLENEIDYRRFPNFELIHIQNIYSI